MLKLNLATLILSVLLTGNVSSYDPYDLSRFSCLYHHNFPRLVDNIQLLFYDDQMAFYAEDRLKEIVKTNRYERNSKYGENFYFFTDESSNPKEICDLGVNEWFKAKDGNHTQMMWEDSRRIGCATGVIKDNVHSVRRYLVCEYYPAAKIDQD